MHSLEKNAKMLKWFLANKAEQRRYAQVPIKLNIFLINCELDNNNNFLKNQTKGNDGLNFIGNNENDLLRMHFFRADLIDPSKQVVILGFYISWFEPFFQIIQTCKYILVHDFFENLKYIQVWLKLLKLKHSVLPKMWAIALFLFLQSQFSLIYFFNRAL